MRRALIKGGLNVCLHVCEQLTNDEPVTLKVV